jgi:lipoate-protein ligase B
VEGLLEVARAAAARLGLRPEIRSGSETGVWLPQGKFAAVGVHIERGVLLHGLAVNALRTPQSFAGLRPCGLDAPVSFALEPKSADFDFDQLGGVLEDEALRVFWHRS